MLLFGGRPRLHLGGSRLALQILSMTPSCSPWTAPTTPARAPGSGPCSACSMNR